MLDILFFIRCLKDSESSSAFPIYSFVHFSNSVTRSSALLKLKHSLPKSNSDAHFISIVPLGCGTLFHPLILITHYQQSKPTSSKHNGLNNSPLISSFLSLAHIIICVHVQNMLVHVISHHIHPLSNWTPVLLPGDPSVHVYAYCFSPPSLL